MMPELAGRRYDGRSLKAWTYYCGRQRRQEGSITDGKGALHANGRAVLEFEKACRPGNVTEKYEFPVFGGCSSPKVESCNARSFGLTRKGVRVIELSGQTTLA